MATMFVRHTVKDFQAWKKVYDGFGPTQKAFSVVAEAVYQADGNPNDITVTHDFANIAAARKFADSDELHQAMESAGVVGAPTIWFTTKA